MYMKTNTDKVSNGLAAKYKNVTDSTAISSWPKRKHMLSVTIRVKTLLFLMAEKYSLPKDDLFYKSEFKEQIKRAECCYFPLGTPETNL